MSRVVAPVFATAVLLLLLLARHGAQGDQLLVNGGFESGMEGWASIDGTLSPDADHARSGAFAAAFQSATSEQAADAFQWVVVQPGHPYEFAGWIFGDDPATERAFLRISWFDSGNQFLSSEDSPWLVGTASAYRFITTTARVSPPQAVAARVSITVQATGPFTAYFDDFTLEGPAPLSATPTLPPLPTPTPPLPSATAIPSTTGAPGTPTAEPTSGAPPTPTPTQPPPGTPWSTGTPSSSPAPTVPPTSSTATLAPSPSSSSPPTTRPTPEETPTATPPGSGEPTVYTTLTNGGFESARSDGTAYGWRKIGGVMGRSGSPVRSGQASLSLESTTTSTKWVYQTLAIAGGGWYEAGAYARTDDPGVVDAFLRISWYATSDGSGEALSSTDSEMAPAGSATFVPMETGPVPAPTSAQSAKVRLMLRPASAAPAQVYFDDVTFTPTTEPGWTATPTPVAPTPSPSLSQTPVATPGPSPSISDGPTPAPTPTASPTVDPDPAPNPVEPGVFDTLTNGSFEEAREDGSPYAWHKVGGEIAVTDLASREGSHSLEFTSRTKSTKWAYQTIRVNPGKHYRAAAWGSIRGGVSGLILRISWYASGDGSGPAIDSVDSEELTAALAQTNRDSIEPASAPSPLFQALTTGVVQAPAEARSARVRLLMRPQSEALGAAHFDAVVFDETAPTAGSPGNSSTPRAAAGTRSSSASQSGGANPSAEGGGQAAVLSAVDPPGDLANVRPAPAAESRPNGDTGDSMPTWLLFVAIALPAAAIASLLAVDSARSSDSADP